MTRQSNGLDYTSWAEVDFYAFMSTSSCQVERVVDHWLSVCDEPNPFLLISTVWWAQPRGCFSFRLNQDISWWWQCRNARRLSSMDRKDISQPTHTFASSTRRIWYCYDMMVTVAGPLRHSRQPGSISCIRHRQGMLRVLCL